MQQQLAERINNLSESATIKMARMSRELKALGRDIISLSLGEPDFATPRFICDAAIDAINEGFTHYPPVPGIPELRKVIAENYSKVLGTDVEMNQVVVSTGAKQSLINTLLCIVNKGDEVIIPSPYWVSYPEMVKVAEGKMVNIKTTVEDDYKISPEQLDEAITERTRVVMLCSPSNPTGSVYTEDELKALVEVLEQYPNVYVISDEIYDLMNFSGEHHSIASINNMHERTVVVNGVSKSFAMTGWRIGYIVAPKWIAAACEKMQGQFTSGACSISQRAALAAVSSDFSSAHEMRDAFKRRRDLVIDKISQIEGIKYNHPGGAFYLFPDVSHYFGKKFEDKIIEDSETFCMYILERANVSLVPGGAFGNDNCIRISFATSESQLSEAMSRIQDVLSQLK